MKKNIIVLTSGLSGSSVVTNLLCRAGYWSGDSTCKKSDYNTHENSRLVELNEQLLQLLSYDQEYSITVKANKLAQAADLINHIDLTAFKTFIADCDKENPWIWKDPRLWVTMPFWIQLLPEDSFQVVFVDRSISQRWISELLRRNIQTINYCATYNAEIKRLIKQFVEKHQLSCCDVLFDELIESPESTLALINRSLDITLELTDLKAVYNKPLYEKARGLSSLLCSILIYLKNYRVRLK